MSNNLKKVKNKNLGNRTLKSQVAKYMLHIYLKFIKDDDVYIYKSWSKSIFKFLWYIRSSFMWIFCIIFFPIFFIGMKIDENILKLKKIYNLQF